MTNAGVIDCIPVIHMDSSEQRFHHPRAAFVAKFIRGTHSGAYSGTIIP